MQIKKRTKHARSASTWLTHLDIEVEIHDNISVFLPLEIRQAFLAGGMLCDSFQRD